MSPIAIFMLRHGAHEAVHDRLCGRAEGHPLGEAGRAEAQALARRLSRERLAAVYSSPIRRARQTAEAVAQPHGLSTEIAEPLIEIDFGDWTGAQFSDLAGREDWRRWNERRDIAAPPNGESMAQTQSRVVGWLMSLRERHAGGAVAAVSHGDVIKAAVMFAISLPLHRHGQLEISPGSLTTIVLHDEGLKLYTLNEIPLAGTRRGADSANEQGS
ncbi:histidine phosphatase family protein [Chelatococcus sambhunathii]|uniref:Histidine phosphatase family protein n=1 Tax=Chelatococcus sambhunathii TaxID=363953 RepID=A0ABU1DDC9_9HYPH|nr:histidine phosphatase family protein [Chelatococcus sambhunathii]MDR4306070.1 histidine phosphatase family protein [Chelatococcus sambhunathii]